MPPRRPDALLLRGNRPRRLEDHVGADASGEALHLVHRLHLAGVEGVGRAQFPGQTQALLDHVGDDSRRRAVCLGRRESHQTDRAGAENSHAGSRLHVGPPGGVQADDEWLDQRAVDPVEIVRQGEDVVGGDGRVLLEEAISMRPALVDPVGAKVVLAPLVPGALAARDARLQADAVANLVSFDIRTHLHNFARRLVAQNVGALHDFVAYVSLVVEVKVGAADAHGLDPYQHLIRGWRRARTLLQT